MLNLIDRKQQRGTALLVSMVILLVMSLVIVQGARSSNLELMIGNNTQSATQALMQAEDSAVLGEKVIRVNYNGAPTTNYGANDDDGVFIVGQMDVTSVDWDELTPTKDNSGGSSREYIIEYLGPSFVDGGSMSMGAGAGSNIRYMYRVSGRGQSAAGSARVIQTIYATSE